MNFLKLSLAAGAVALSATTASAVSIMIDDFDTFQKVADGPVLPVIPSSSTIAAGDVLGGFRTLSVVTTPTGTLLGSQLTSTGLGVPNPSALQFSNSAGQTGLATVSYGVAAGGGALGDLTGAMGENDRFFFADVSGDLIGATFSATVTDGSMNSATVTELLGPGFSPFQLFSDFTGVDFTDVASLTFTLNSSGVSSFDGQIGSISAVPLPASALLLLGGLGGFAAFGSAKRRRRKS